MKRRILNYLKIENLHHDQYSSDQNYIPLEGWQIEDLTGW